MMRSCIKKAEAENEWLNGVARIARGAGVTTTVTEELDASGNVKTRTTRTVTGLGSWQAYAWLLERRHPERWGADRATSVDSGTATGTTRMAYDLWFCHRLRAELRPR